MINKIELQNFQSHQNTALQFHPNINIIIGQSDSGKTAILRALRWVLFNKPQGEALRSSWGGVTLVTAQIDENYISRIRSDTKNSYKVNEQELKAIGADVPEHIKKIFNMNDLNFQHQLDQPFLLSDTPGSVATHFNKIARLEMIDTAVQSVSKWLRSISQEFDRQHANKKTYQTQLENFNFLPEMEQAVVTVEKQEEEKQLLQKNSTQLSVIVQTMKKIQVQVDLYQPLIRLSPFVEEICAQEVEKAKQEDLQKDLQSLLRKIQQTNRQLVFLKQIQVLRKDVEEYEVEGTTLSKLQQKYRQLKDKLLNLKEAQKNIDILSVTVKNMEVQFKKEMPDICPLCGAGVK